MDTNKESPNTIPKENEENMFEIEIPYPLFQYLSRDQCNLENICRICLCIGKESLYPLFTQKKDSVLANMVISLSEVQISEDDGLPTNICVNCQKELILCYDFKNKCVKSEYTLRSILKGEFIDKFRENTPESIDDPKTKELISESDIKVEIKEEDVAVDDVDYLQDLKNTISDEEALCIVGEMKNNEKKITIIKNKENSFQEIVLQNKIRKKNKKLKHACTYCPKKFHKLKSLRAHTSKHHKKSESPFPCDQCKEGFNSEFDLILHGMLHSPGPNWTCTECHKEFKGKTALRRHIQRHMQCKPFSCEACGKTFVELCALRRHSLVHIPLREENKLPCRYCDKRYSNKSSLQAHECSHSGSRQLSCACGKMFSNARLLASHQRVHSNDKPHVCHHCGKGFRHESTRNTHVRTHTGERPYSCACCGKTFIQRSNMTLHMRTHTGEKPYTCSFCDRKFSSGSTLKAHERTHTGERPYSCKICGKSFARLNLKLHMRLHTGERPHACSVCPKRFINAARLRDHTRTHTGERPFECSLCSCKFPTKSHLVKHCQSHNKKRNKPNSKGVVMYMPVTVSDKSLNDTKQMEKPTQYMIVEPNTDIPQNVENLPTIHVAPDSGKTEVIVVGAEQNLITNGVAYVQDLNCTSNMELVTVNEEEMSLTTGNAVIEGTTVKVYQYDQSLLQIHSGAGQLTISRISSKMTANLM